MKEVEQKKEMSAILGRASPLTYRNGSHVVTEAKQLKGPETTKIVLLNSGIASHRHSHVFSVQS